MQERRQLEHAKGGQVAAGEALAGGEPLLLDRRLERAQRLGQGAIAAEVAPWVNEDMAASILTLYRGADPEVPQALAARVEAADRRPGLALSALGDPYVSSDLAPAVVERFGATMAELPGQGHWWMLEDPNPAADALVAFWSSL